MKHLQLQEKYCEKSLTEFVLCNWFAALKLFSIFLDFPKQHFFLLSC